MECSIIAFVVERDLTIFGVYILGGLGIILVPLFDLGLARLAFQAVVYWTLSMSAVWFADKALKAAKRRPLVTFKEE